ncbi:glycoside hydrolase family 78 protein [Treponema sp. TIM-1]|uniref:family 78 glycoside hydrolase catalytic domain n=1 Tax=Treponema sp. TIM-1 TaxID=2898417 RepID=UPI00397F33B4
MGNWIGICRGELNRWLPDAEDIDEVNLRNQGKVRVQQRSILLRKEFTIPRALKNGLLRICGLGFYRFWINGKPGDDRVLAPIKSDYFKKVLYDVYDLSPLLGEGPNICAVELGNGWFCPQEKWWGWRMSWYGSPRLLFDLEITLTDGTKLGIGADETWKLREGPVLFNCLYDGETYDANEEPLGWTEAGYDDALWQHAALVEAPTENLVENKTPPIRVTGVLEPINIFRLDELRQVYDFGENWAARPEITVRGKRGQKILLNFAEYIHDDLTLDRRTNDDAVVEDTYILRGGDWETWEPAFVWHGYRYLLITRSHADITVLEVKSKKLHSDLTPTGQFYCSNPRLQALHEIILRTQLSCLMGIPIDCPQRDERLPWLGDAHVTAETGMYNFDMREFYHNWLQDIRLGQHRRDGWYQHIAPWPYFQQRMAFFKETTADWSAALPIIADQGYRFYGDPSFITDNYDSLKRYLDYCEKTLDGDFLFASFGDWKSPDIEKDGEVPPYVGALFFHKNLLIAASFAEFLGKADDARHYTETAAALKKRLLEKYYDTAAGIFGDGTQFSLAMAILSGVIPDIPQAIDALVRAIDAAGGHLRGGIFGAKMIPEVLHRCGRPDVAYRLLTAEGYPGFFDLISRGRTTLPELWDGGGSGNHGMFGGVDVILYRMIGGLSIDHSRKIPLRVQPWFPPGMEEARCSLDTSGGRISCGWRRQGAEVALVLEIPPGTEAEFIPPAGEETAPAILSGGVYRYRFKDGPVSKKTAGGTNG